MRSFLAIVCIIILYQILSVECHESNRMRRNASVLDSRQQVVHKSVNEPKSKVNETENNAPSTRSPTKPGKSHALLIVALVVAALLFIGAMIIIWFVIDKKKKKRIQTLKGKQNEIAEEGKENKKQKSQQSSTATDPSIPNEPGIDTSVTADEITAPSTSSSTMSLHPMAVPIATGDAQKECTKRKNCGCHMCKARRKLFDESSTTETPTVDDQKSASFFADLFSTKI